MFSVLDWTLQINSFYITDMSIMSVREKVNVPICPIETGLYKEDRYS